MFKKGIRVRRLLTLAVFGIVWFYRDYKATAFDEQEREAQEVLSKEQDHKQRQKQESDQREMMGLLARIDLEQRKSNASVTPEEIDAEEARLWSKDAKADGATLTDDVEEFTHLLDRVSMPSDERKQWMDSAAKASGVAKRVADLGNAVAEATDHPTEEQAAAMQQKLAAEEKLEDEWYDANESLTAAWERLESAAQQDEADASGSASAARFIAWIGTILSALMLADWKTAFGELTSSEEEQPSAA
jgi:hypothetical protein